MPRKNIPEDQTKFNYINEKTKNSLQYWAVTGNVGMNLSRALERIHKDRPKVVFLTQTSSIPYGIAFKEAWKTAYPNDSLPKFLTIDVKATRGWARLNNLKQRLYEEFYKRSAPVVDFNGEKFIAYDEISDSMRKDEKFREFYESEIEKRANRSATKVIMGLKEKLRRYGVRSGDNVVVLDDQTPEGGPLVDKMKYSHMGTMGIAKKVVEEAANEVGGNIHVLHNYISSTRLPQRGLGPWIGGTQTEGYVSYKHTLMPTRRYSGQEERQISRSNIDYLKDLGKESGKKIREKRSLESKVSSVVGIFFLFLSFLFLSANITGNSIASLSVKKSSLIGAGLLFIALVSAFIYLKRR